MKAKILYIDFDIPYLFSDLEYPVGGTAVEWSGWLKGLSENNQDISLLTFKGAKKIIKKDISFKVIESYSINWGIPVLRWMYYRVPKLYTSIRKSKADFVVQQNASLLSGIVAIICLIQKKKFIYRVGSDIDATRDVKSKLKGLSLISFKIALYFSKLLICQNEFQFEKLKSRFPSKTLIKIHNPFIFNDFNKINNLEHRNYVSWIGNFRDVKNLPELYNIAKELPDFKFKIAGMESFSNHSIQNKTILKLKKLNNVEFVGYLIREELFNLLNKSICLLNTSKYEGLSNTYIEAMIAGTPIVTTINADPDNIIFNNKLGQVAKDYKMLPIKIQEVKNNTNYRDFSKYSFDFAKRHFHYLSQSKKMIKALD
tara:strand:+ start:1793 stop:2902 length:1110 start_codon:yes stop_codon:yes gene_type:complete